MEHSKNRYEECLEALLNKNIREASQFFGIDTSALASDMASLGWNSDETGMAFPKALYEHPQKDIYLLLARASEGLIRLEKKKDDIRRSIDSLSLKKERADTALANALEKKQEDDNIPFKNDAAGRDEGNYQRRTGEMRYNISKHKELKMRIADINNEIDSYNKKICLLSKTLDTYDYRPDKPDSMSSAEAEASRFIEWLESCGIGSGLDLSVFMGQQGAKAYASSFMTPAQPKPKREKAPILLNTLAITIILWSVNTLAPKSCSEKLMQAREAAIKNQARQYSGQQILNNEMIRAPVYDMRFPLIIDIKDDIGITSYDVKCRRYGNKDWFRVGYMIEVKEDGLSINIDKNMPPGWYEGVVAAKDTGGNTTKKEFSFVVR